MKKISIVIPVYNSEAYLSECLESIRSQSYQNYETILVNDGSTDSSAEICERFAQLDARFIHIKQENQGTSAARNTGIKAATGDYLTFMDNDDFWVGSLSLQEVMVRLAQTNADLLMHQSRIYDSATGQLSDVKKMNIEGSKTEVLKTVISSGLMSSTVWNKVVRLDLIRSCEIMFPTGKRNEDTAWVSKLIRCVDSVVWYSDSFYAYRKGHDYAQTSKPLLKKHVLDLVDICHGEYEEIAALDCTDQERFVYYSFLAYPYAVLLSQCALFPKNAFSEEEDEAIASMKSILRNNLDPAVHAADLSMRMLGFSLTRRLLGFALKRKYPSLTVEY